MKTTSFKTLVLGTPWRNLTYCIIETDEGITGIGEARVLGKTHTVTQYLKDVERHFIGHDPFDVEALYRRMTLEDFGKPGEVVYTGLALVELAFWDIIGKSCNQPVYRLRGDYLAIVTIAAAEIFRLLVRDLESITGGVYGIINFSDSLQQYRPIYFENFVSRYELNPSQVWVGLLSWISILFVLVILKRLTNSPWGRALRAVREDEDAVRALGKNAVWLKLQSFMLGAGIAGLAGVFLAFNYGSLQTTTFVPLLTFYVWAIMILGGVGSLSGPIFGSIIFWVIISETDKLAALIFENANGQQLAGVRFVLVGLLIMVLMIFRPSGLLGKKEELLLNVK